MTIIAALLAVIVGLLTMLYRLTLRHGKTLLQIDERDRHINDEPSHDENDQRRVLYAYGAPPGSVAMNFELPAITGDSLTLTRFKGRRTLLIFIAPDCPASQSILPALAGMSTFQPEDQPQIIIVSTGGMDENRALMERYGVTFPVVVQDDNEVSLLHYISGTPMGYLLNEDGITETQRLDGPMAILGAALVLRDKISPTPEQSISPANLEQPAQPQPLQRADDLPEFHVALLDGGELSTRSLQNRRSFIILFDPLSQPCVDLLPDLTAMHADTDQPDVVMITRRDPELTRELMRAHEMRYKIGVQEHWHVSRLFGSLLVPSACVVVPGGYLESNLATGQQEVLGLMKRVRPARRERRLVSLASLASLVR
jgi:peroxiredoxin